MVKCEPWLATVIEEAGGYITFERFMAEALYHPDHGYYAANVADVGREGDFSTSATLCPAFGEALAQWAMARGAEDFPTGDFTLIEVGAGNGQLAENFLTAWHKLGAPEVPYVAVDTSPRLGEALAKRASSVGFQVESSLPSALETASGRAIIFSNELIDAFPARQLCWNGEDWCEVGLRVEGGALIEGLLPFTDAVDADAPARPRDGGRLFIQPRYHAWLRENLKNWRAGRMLSIDYGAGYPASECRAYRGQERIEGDAIYGDAGKQDLTCDVNFADVQRWGQAMRWETITRQPQSDFLEAWLPDVAERGKEDEALAFLANPFGAGGAFLTLEQRASGEGG